MGISKSAVQKFETQKSFPEKNWPKLRAWYVRDRKARYGRVDDDPADKVLNVLDTISDVPLSQKPQALYDIARTYRAMYERLKLPCPAWVGILEAMAQAEAAAEPPRKEYEYRIPGREKEPPREG